MMRVPVAVMEGLPASCYTLFFSLSPPDVAPVVLGFNYEAHNAPAYKLNNSTKDILAIGEHLSMFWLNLHCACAETAISELQLQFWHRH